MLQRRIIWVLSFFGLLIGVLATPALAQDAITMVGSSDGRVEVFFAALEPSGGVYHAYQLKRNAQLPSSLGQWSGWEKFSPTPDATSQLVSARDQAGKLFVAWISQGAIWFAQQSVSNGSFGAPVRIGTQDLHGLTIAMNRDGRIELFALSSGGGAWSVYETMAGSRNWASKPLGGHDMRALAPAAYFDGRLGLAALGGDGHVYFTAQYAPGGDWYPWTSLQGENIQEIAAATNADGRLNVAAIGGDGNFWEISQNNVGEQSVGGWSEWRYRASGPFIGPLKLQQNADGRLEASMRKSENSIVHIWQKAPNGSWSDEVAPYQISASNGFDLIPLTDNRLALVSFRNYLPGSAQAHSEIEFVTTTQDHANSFWALSTAPAHLFTKPPPPPMVTIATFAANPDYVNQGDPSILQWTLSTSGGCTLANLILTERVYGQTETLIGQQSSPGISGSEKVTPPAISSPVYYKLSVSCKGAAPVSKEIPLGFAPKQVTAPNVVLYGPFIAPSPPHEKQSFTISWTFENVGTAKSLETQVDLYLDGVKEGDTKTVSKLSPAEVTSVSWSVTKELTGYIHTAEIRSGGSSLALEQFTMDP